MTRSGRGRCTSKFCWAQKFRRTVGHDGTWNISAIDALRAELLTPHHVVQAYSFLLSRSTQRLHRVPGQGQPQPDTPPLRISAVSLRTYLYEVWRRRCLQVSALKTTACKIDICFWSQHILAATSVRSLGKLLRTNKLPPCKG